MGTLSLHIIDWAIIVVYLLLALTVGIIVKGKSESDRESYFLAGRSLPWWWAGMSIAATTFAADTPLAVTGIVASKGISGNWIWLSWIGVHTAVVVYFAARWRNTETLTDAEFISIRYSGAQARWLRVFRAGLYGIVYNCIILGWVLSAMVKIVTPFFHWNEWLPGVMGVLNSIWPSGSALGTASEGVTIICLLLIVGTYSTLGGIRGVIFTDLIQLTIAVAGSIWLALSAWEAIGGRQQMLESLSSLYGSDHAYLDLFPDFEHGWASAAGLGAFAFGIYLIVQSYANIPADGGGYLMQRLNTTKDRRHARRASLLFVLLQYVVRTIPWLVVAVAALILIPIGNENSIIGSAAEGVTHDRELAYPVLMGYLLPPVALGLMVTSLLAAFMSTIDTHINWGASYIVNDIFLRVRPEASNRQQILVARLSVSAFAMAAIIVSLQIETIEQAWKWVAALGAALGIPTALRWLWWRINATAELGAMVAGLATAAYVYIGTDLAYEFRLLTISGSSVIGMAAGMLLGPETDRKVIEAFVEKADPSGLWKNAQNAHSLKMLAILLIRWIAVAGGTICILAALHQFIFFGSQLTAALLVPAGAVSIWLAAKHPA